MRIFFKFVVAMMCAVVCQMDVAAAGKQCGTVQAHVDSGAGFHGAKCKSSSGCTCQATECSVEVTLPSTGKKSTQTQYSNASCSSAFPGSGNSGSGSSKVCGPVKAKVKSGGVFHGATCDGTGSCDCKATECIVEVTLPATGTKSKQTQYSAAACEPAQVSSSPFPNSVCKTVTSERAYQQCFHGPCCMSKKGCICSAKQCGPKSPKNTGQITFSDVQCTPK